LTALVGRGRALLLMTSGRVLDAAAALAHGLFDDVVPRDRFDAHWPELAHQIARAPRDALVGIKAAQRPAFPTARPHLPAAASDPFARPWVAAAHCEMVDEAEARRRAARGPG